jgi:hypothetical protein
MKKKWFLIFGVPAFSSLVVMTGEAILSQKPIQIRPYVVTYVSFVGILAWNVLRKDRE